MDKKTGIFIRLKEKEKNHLMGLAKKNGLSLSEYIRIKLLEEQNVDQPSSYKNDMTTFGVIAYYLLGKLARKSLSQEEINEVEKKAQAILKAYDIQYEI